MTCLCCGATEFCSQPILWRELIEEWRIAPHEVAYIDRQQGCRCARCGCNLRSLALALALMRCHGFAGLLADWVQHPSTQALRVLELNGAGGLTSFLSQLPGHRLLCYPEVDMQALPFEDEQFDLVVHSDTLEHVPQPVRGLAECRRVLKPGGFCAFTIPVIVDRLTVSRAGMPPSYHGSPANPGDCLVHTEYGADFWRQAVQAGFAECRLFTLEHPAAHALVGVRCPREAPQWIAPAAVPLARAS